MLVDSITMQAEGPVLLIGRMGQETETVEGDLVVESAHILNSFLSEYADPQYTKTQTVLTQEQYTIEVTTETES